MFNPKSLVKGRTPNFVKATAEDYYLWETDNSYLPATSNHENFNVVDFNVRHGGEVDDNSPEYNLTSNKARIFLLIIENKLFVGAYAKFDRWFFEELKLEINSQVIDCPPVEQIELTPSAINDISQYAYLAYKAIKRKDNNWYKFVNDSWVRERTEYLHKGKLILADNKIAELVSTTALCVRPNNDKLVIIQK